MYVPACERVCAYQTVKHAGRKELVEYCVCVCVSFHTRMQTLAGMEEGGKSYHLEPSQWA